MFRKIIEAIKLLFASLFGAKKSKPEPRVEPKPSEIKITPQDGSEVSPDTTVINISEVEEVAIDPTEPDREFDPGPIEEEELPVDTVTPEEVKEATDEDKEIPSSEEPNENQRYLWCLDNGHGKLTAGKRSPIFDDGVTQFFEYEFNRDIIRRIIEGLEANNIAYYNVVPEVEIGDFLQGRVERANEKRSKLPKIYLSVHSNAAPAPSINDWGLDSISGIETWFYHNSKRGQKVASIFQNHLIAETGWKSRGLKSRPNSQFYVLRKTRMTAVLTENGFYNNEAQAEELMKEVVRQKIADAHIKAILEIEKNGI